MSELTNQPYKDAIEAKIVKIMKESFDGKNPLNRGLVAVVDVRQRGTTCDIYVDAPGAYRMNALPEWSAIVAAATPAYVTELERINQTPGVSIWSDPDSVYVGTASPASAVNQDGAAVAMPVRESMLYFQSEVAKGNIKPAGGNNSSGQERGDKITGIGKNFYPETPWKLNQSNTASPLVSFWLANYHNSGGKVIGIPFRCSDLQAVYALLTPTKSVVVQKSNGYTSNFDSGYLDGSIPTGLTLKAVGNQGEAVYDQSEAYYGYVYDAVWGMPPVTIVELPGSGETYGWSADEINRYLAAHPVSEKNWVDVGMTDIPGVKTGWTEIAAMWPSSAEFKTTYSSSNTGEQRSAVRALPQIDAQCGLESLVMRFAYDTAGHYKFDTKTGIPVKVIVVSESVLYTGVPMDWLVQWAGVESKAGRITAAQLAELTKLHSENSDVVITGVAYANVVMLPKDLVTNSTLHRDYAKARKNACKDDDFMKQKFNDMYTYGTLETLINGSLATREFYGTRVLNQYVEFKIKEGALSIGNINVTKTGGSITTVQVTGDLSGTYTAPDNGPIEAYNAGYSLSGASVAELAAWAQVDANQLAQQHAVALQSIADVGSTFAASGSRDDKYSFDNHLLRYGGFPDYVVINNLSKDMGDHLVMVSKGAVRIGPTISKLLVQSRSIL